LRFDLADNLADAHCSGCCLSEAEAADLDVQLRALSDPHLNGAVYEEIRPETRGLASGVEIDGAPMLRTLPLSCFPAHVLCCRVCASGVDGLTIKEFNPVPSAGPLGGYEVRAFCGSCSLASN
jgi:hypothetical protein